MKKSKNNNYDTSNQGSVDDSDSNLLFNIESEDEDNLYSLKEDEDRDGDESEDLEDEDGDEPEEGDEEDTDEEESKGNPSILLLKILSTPVEGWKELKRRGYTPDEIASGCFFPLIAIASISEFAAKMYGVTITLTQCLMNALSAFVAFFFGYFTVLLIGGYILPKQVRVSIKQNFGKEFVMMNLSTLALFYTAYKLCPMVDAILVFLPLWTIYLIYKGVRFLRVPTEVESRTKVILAFLIIASPILWGWMMELFF